MNGAVQRFLILPAAYFSCLSDQPAMAANSPWSNSGQGNGNEYASGVCQDSTLINASAMDSACMRLHRHTGGDNSTSALADSGLPAFGAGRYPVARKARRSLLLLDSGSSPKMTKQTCMIAGNRLPRAARFGSGI
jgi:hypothetical protein